MRRLSFNLWRAFNEQNLSDWRYVEFLRGDSSAVGRGADYYLRIAKLAPGEISQFLDFIPYLHAAELIALLPNDLAADALELTSTEKQLQIFEEFDDQQSLKMLELLAPETSAKIIKQLDFNEAKRILETLSKDTSERIVKLMR